MPTGKVIQISTSIDEDFMYVAKLLDTGAVEYSAIVLTEILKQELNKDKKLRHSHEKEQQPKN